VTFNRGKDAETSNADKTVTGSNIQKRKRHRNVHWQIGLSLGATFNRGKDTEMSNADKTVTGSNIQTRKRHRTVVGKNNQKRKGDTETSKGRRGKDTEMSTGR
jgi:hypothetical protein